MKRFTNLLFVHRISHRFKTFLRSATLALGLVLAMVPVQHVHAEASLAQARMPAASVSVNINTGSAEEIAEALIGVGMKKAQAIIDYREQHGPFTDKSQLVNVKGIGEATVKKNLSVIDI